MQLDILGSYSKITQSSNQGPLRSQISSDMGIPSSDLREATGLVGVFTDLLTTLGIRDDPVIPGDELRSLVTVPWAAFNADRELRSPLTESGAPFEISLQLTGPGDTALRYTVDTADRRYALAANRNRYFDHARTITDASETLLQELFDRHLGGAPPNTPARVMHSIGFARYGRRRTTLYFPMNWLAADELANRLNRQVSAISQAHALLGLPPVARLQVAGYDFVGTKMVRWKTYSWMPPVDPAALASLAKTYPSLLPAMLVYDAFVSDVAPSQREQSLFLQLSGDPSGIKAKIFFFSRAWGWSSESGLVRVIGFLNETFDLNFTPLLHLRDATIRHNFPLMLGLTAVAGHPLSPSVTFYFWPV